MTQVVILAAGMGTRLARSHPKPLTTLIDGRTILQQQVENLKSVLGDKLRLMIVVGYKYEQVINHMPDATFVYNPDFETTNTSKSLLRALELTSNEAGVLWLNGDVVFDAEIVEVLKSHMNNETSVICVNTQTVSNEEVKYTLNSLGFVAELSKDIPPNLALGEAIGINFISAKDKGHLITRLKEVAPQDYFEKGIERTIIADGVDFEVEVIDRSLAVEIDSPEDLEAVNRALHNRLHPEAPTGSLLGRDESVH